MLTEQQKLARQKGLGGTDIGAICGKNKWKTIEDVYLEKKGLKEGGAMSPQAKWGILLEPLIRENYCQTFSKEVVVPTETYFHKDYPFLLANVDGLIDDDGILEIKTVTYENSEWGKQGTDQIPASYLLQCHHYMHVYDRDYTDVSLLSQGYREKYYKVLRNKALEQKLLEISTWFWNECVLKDNPPLLNATTRYETIVNEELEKTIKEGVFSVEMMQTYKELLYHTEQKKFHLEQEEVYKKFLSDFLEQHDSDELIDKQGKTLLTYKINSRKTFDTKKFQTDKPDLYEQYLRETHYRYMRVYS